MWWSEWNEVSKGTSGGFFKGMVISEADINFSNRLYSEVDIYMCLDDLIKVGALVITFIIAVEAATVVFTNLQSIVLYVKEFGVLQGLQMYKYLGLYNLSNGVISWIQTDTADGDSSLDDLIDKGIPIYQRGKTGEEALRMAYPGKSQVYLQTYVDGVKGGRYVDQLSKNIAYEAKVGYTCLSQRIKMQILKDAYLKNSGAVDDAAWVFYRSDITGRVGASKQLLDFLEKYGISYIINE